MDKKLKLYKMPPFADMVNVVAITDTPPTNFTSGDVYVDTSYSPYRLFRAVNNTTWGVVQPENGKFYCTTENGEPKILEFSSNIYSSYDTIFPETGRHAEIYDFTYSANRMGSAPSISASLMYERCLDEEWSDRVCTIFNGVKYYIDKTPPSSKSNTDARYKHDISLLSEHVLLENVYFINIVDEDADFDYVVRDWTTFQFFGDVYNFVERLNLSLEYSRLHENGIGFKIVVDNDLDVVRFINNLEEKEKLVSIDKMFIIDALKEIYNLWELPYYYDGYTIHIGFSNESIASSHGVQMPTLEYGFENELLTINKNNNTDRAINRCTGVGGTDNIPYFYPNQNPNGLEIHYVSNDTEMLNYAKIVNPYKTSSLQPSSHFPQYDGSYFEYKYGRVEYEFDGRYTGVNSIRIRSGENGEYEILEPTRYKTRVWSDQGVTLSDVFSNGGTPVLTTIYKAMYVWVGDVQNQNVGMVIKDTITDYFVKKHQSFGGQYIDYDEKYNACIFKTIRFTVNKVNTTTENYERISDDTPLVYTNTSNIYWNLWTTYTWWNLGLRAGNWSTPKQGVGINDEKYSDCFPYSNEVSFAGYNCLEIIISYEYPTVYLNDIGRNFIRLKNDTNTSLRLGMQKLGWIKGDENYRTSLYNYGIRVSSNVNPQVGDTIYFTRETGYSSYISNLMPYIFRLTGDIWYNAKNNYYPKAQNTFFTFDEEYSVSHAKEHIEDFKDIHPTITGCLNADGVRIDKIVDIAFDENDNNDLDNDGNLLHPYFYIKIAKTSSSTQGFGFNLFDCAIDSGAMTISMKTGKCGGCNFKIQTQRGTDGFMRNPIGVYTEQTTVGGVIYNVGEPVVDENGNVRTNFNQDIQQDSENNSVWLCVLKDNETYTNSILPTYNIYPDVGDEFVITNIALPYSYVIEAEKRLEKKILEYMEKHNPEVFGFSVKFSSVFYNNNYLLMDRWINESSSLNIKYNGITKKYYAESYSYKMTNNVSLPEININFKEESKVRWGGLVRRILQGVGFSQTTNENNNVKSSRSTRQTTISSNRGVADVYENIDISGDLFVKGVSISKTINESLGRISTIEDSFSKSSGWNATENRSTLSNIFVDGAFKYGHNRIKCGNETSITSNTGGLFDGTCEKIKLTKNENAFFDQKINVSQGVYNVQMYIKADEDEFEGDFYICVEFSDSNGEVIEFTGRNIENFSEKCIGQWGLCIHRFTITEDIETIRIAIKSFSENPVNVNIDGVMVYKEDYSIMDGSLLSPSVFTPKKYIPSSMDVDTAVRKSGGSSVTFVTWKKSKKNDEK